MNDSMTSSTSTVYHGVMSSTVCELRAMRQNCFAMIGDYVTRFDQAQGVASENMEEEHRVMDEDRRTIFTAVSNYWIRANQLCDADSIEGRADLNATLKAIEGMRRDFDRTEFFNVDFRYLKQNKLPEMRITTKDDNGMIYAYDDPKYPVAVPASEASKGLPPTGSKRGREQNSPNSIVQQKKKGPMGPRHSSPIIVPDEPRRCYLNRDNPTLGNGQRIFDLQSINGNANAMAGVNNVGEVDDRGEEKSQNSADSILMPPPPTMIRRSSRTAAWVDGQSPALLNPTSNVISIVPGAAGGAISRQPASSADPVSSSSGPAMNPSTRAPNIFKEVKEDNKKLIQEKEENAKLLEAQQEEMRKMKAEMERMTKEKAEKSRLEKEKKERKKKEKAEAAAAAANAAAAAAAIAAANAAADEAANRAAEEAARKEEQEIRRQNDEIREANRLVAEDMAKRRAEMEEMRKMLEDLRRPSQDEDEEEEEEEEHGTEYVPLGRPSYEPLVENARQSRPTHPSPSRQGAFGAGNAFVRASQSVPARRAEVSRAIANLCDFNVNERRQTGLQRNTAHLSIISLPTQNVDASRFTSSSDFLMEKRLALESAKEARPEVKFGGGSVVNFRATMAMFDNNTQSSCLGPREKLIELQNYVTGAPATMVASNLLNPDSAEAYAKARRDLEAVYGSTPESSWSMLDDIKRGKMIADDDVVGLQQLLASLMMTHALAKSAKKDEEMTRPDRLREVLSARAEFLMVPFAQKLLRIRTQEGRSFDFEDFRSLISDHISVMQLCGGARKIKQHAKVAFTSGIEVVIGNEGKANGEKSYSSTDMCALCGNGHQTQYCESLAELDSDARFKKLIHSNICVKCMKVGHHQRDCTAPPPSVFGL